MVYKYTKHLKKTHQAMNYNKNDQMVAIIIIIYLDCIYKMNHVDIDRVHRKA